MLCCGWSAIETSFFGGAQYVECRHVEAAPPRACLIPPPMQPSPTVAMQMQLLLITACSTLLVAARVSPAHDVELKALAGSVRRAGVLPNNDRDRHRLTLRHLESMWHTSLGKEVG